MLGFIILKVNLLRSNFSLDILIPIFTFDLFRETDDTLAREIRKITLKGNPTLFKNINMRNQYKKHRCIYFIIWWKLNQNL